MRRFFGQCRFYLFERKPVILKWWTGRTLYLYYHCLLYAFYRYVQKDYYAALNSLLRYERDIKGLVNREMLSPGFVNIRSRFLKKHIFETDNNKALASFIRSQEAKDIRRLFSSFDIQHQVRMRYPKKNDDSERQGDLMILKPYLGDKEKGVLFIQYDEGVKRFSAIYNTEKLAKYYRFVIEPSTCGYQNAMYFLCSSLETEVLIEAQFKPDFDYIKSLNNNFVPVRLGAGDWTDPEKFSLKKDVIKKYDVVMIANWLRWKRHDVFFSSLAQLGDSITKVAVIGYPIGDRTLPDIKKESEKHQVADKIDFYERIPFESVAEIIQKSKIGILLSKEEGANRAIYECFFSGVPVILSSMNRGVNRDHLNNCTGVLSDDNQLPEMIKNMITEYSSYEPRRWAEANTGYLNATMKLNEIIRTISRQHNENWTQDIFYKHNSPHARYKISEELDQADRAVTHLYQFLRN
jgi:hypothetical protein